MKIAFLKDAKARTAARSKILETFILKNIFN